MPIAPPGKKGQYMVYAPYSGQGVKISENAIIPAMGYVSATELFIEIELNKILNSLR